MLFVENKHQKLDGYVCSDVNDRKRVKFLQYSQGARKKNTRKTPRKGSELGLGLGFGSGRLFPRIIHRF